jgi:ribosomal protein S12 methylthiotransferase
LDKIRSKVPGIAIRTTLIAGHPGEGEKEFEEMVQFVERSRFERLGIFTYSHEENTSAYLLNDDVPEDVKQDRAQTVMEVQENISAEINEEKVGKTYKVLIDRLEGGKFIGRTEHDSPEVDNEVIISADENYLRIGDFVNIKITEASAFDLIGEPV